MLRFQHLMSSVATCVTDVCINGIMKIGMVHCWVFHIWTLNPNGKWYMDYDLA